MKKIIGGKRYDTDTADKIANWDNGLHGQFGYIDETLYRTKKGGWFLVGEGGDGSPYREGEKLIPYLPEEARLWLENRGSLALLETHFADQIEDA